MKQPRPCQPFSYLEHNAAVRPAAPAVIDSGRTVTFAELQAAVLSAAARLRRRGVGEGSVVGLHLANVWEHVSLELAVPLLGAINLPLPPALGAAELRWAVERTGAQIVVEPEEAASLCAPGPAEAIEAPPASPDRVVEIALTSGTTGLPKLASLTAGLKQATFEGLTARLEVVPEDRVLIMSPIAQGIGGMCLYCLRRGAALVMLRQPRFTAEHTLRIASQTRASLLAGVPTNLVRMLASPDLGAADLSATRCSAVAGSPLAPEVAQAWEVRSGAPVCSFYGSMDAGQLAVGSPSDPAQKRWTSVGRPHDCLEVTIIGGEICARGPTIQERYWGEDFGPYSEDGWAHMGDLGHLDADGYLHVDGRIKDVIIRGGSNVNPYEVENLLRRHPAVADVCLVGRPDPELGERGVAFVVARAELTLDDLRALLGAAGLARYKWPERLELIEEIPLSGPGKVDRRTLRARAVALAAD